MGQLETIWIKRFKKGPMDSVDRATLETAKGIVGNANQGGHRQVTVIEREAWDRMMEELPCHLDPSARRANLLVNGISLIESRKQILQVGDVRIRILGETRPCERMEEAQPGLQAAMRPKWGGGAYGEVLNDGEIVVGDQVAWDGSP